VHVKIKIEHGSLIFVLRATCLYCHLASSWRPVIFTRFCITWLVYGQKPVNVSLALWWKCLQATLISRILPVKVKRYCSYGPPYTMYNTDWSPVARWQHKYVIVVLDNKTYFHLQLCRFWHSGCITVVFYGIILLLSSCCSAIVDSFFKSALLTPISKEHQIYKRFTLHHCITLWLVTFWMVIQTNHQKWFWR